MCESFIQSLSLQNPFPILRGDILRTGILSEIDGEAPVPGHNFNTF